MADIAKDRDVLPFQWFDDKGKYVIYRMTRHVFAGFGV
jgi:hypothetical protein